MNDRSREDKTFIGPPNLDTSNLETPRTRKRGGESINMPEAPASKQPRTRPYHVARPFKSLKSGSIDRERRLNCLKEIKKLWRVSDEQLMTLPFAPHRSLGLGSWEPLPPLDWNTKLLRALGGFGEGY